MRALLKGVIGLSKFMVCSLGERSRPWYPNQRTSVLVGLMTLSLCLVYVVEGSANENAAENNSELAANWQLVGPSDNKIDYYEHSGTEPSVILFWATWCPYCKKLMPELETLRAELAGSGVRFYALNIWEDGDPVKFSQSNGYGFELLLNADKVAERYGIKGTPGLIVASGDKRIVYNRKSGTPPAQVIANIRLALGKI